MHKPTVPMTPEALPQQRVVAVRGLPPRPEGFTYHSENDDRPPVLRRVQHTRNGEFLCQTEWAWSPMHNAIHAYYFNPRRDHWLLWVRWFDDEGSPWGWRWWFVGWAPRLPGVDDRTAAIHLLAGHWREQRENSDLDPPHWINELGEFDAADLRAITRYVWPEDESDD